LCSACNNTYNKNNSPRVIHHKMSRRTLQCLSLEADFACGWQLTVLVYQPHNWTELWWGNWFSLIIRALGGLSSLCFRWIEPWSSLLTLWSATNNNTALIVSLLYFLSVCSRVTQLNHYQTHSANIMLMSE
jgi:hypothetical protein